LLEASELTDDSLSNARKAALEDHWRNTLQQATVLWVVTPGGLDLSQFPFGEAVRLLSV